MIGKYLIFLGLILLVCGLILTIERNDKEVEPKITERNLENVKKPNLFSWFGKLPGDISYQTKTTSFFAPITSMLLISFVVSIFLKLLQR